jgi:hypothetical protein
MSFFFFYCLPNTNALGDILPKLVGEWLEILMFVTNIMNSFFMNKNHRYENMFFHSCMSNILGNQWCKCGYSFFQLAKLEIQFGRVVII